MVTGRDFFNRIKITDSSFFIALLKVAIREEKGLIQSQLANDLI